ncbi:MAG: hypothetical protein RIB84_10065 [Sneathiellaceae bacterium]
MTLDRRIRVPAAMPALMLALALLLAVKAADRVGQLFGVAPFL